MNEGDLLKIDGSFGEGGGAILRLGAAYSVLFKRPIIIKNIRANRPKPGLRLQHLLGLKTLTELSNSSLSPCRVGSEEISVTPNYKHEVKSNIHINISTAASIGLLLQPIQIASLGFKKSEKIKIFLKGGGTFGKWAPSVNYLKEVTYKLFEKSGLKIDIDILKHGFYPKGGAQLICVIHPSKENVKPINLTELGNIDLIQCSQTFKTVQMIKPLNSDLAQRTRNYMLELKLLRDHSPDLYHFSRGLSPTTVVSKVGANMICPNIIGLSTFLNFKGQCSTFAGT